MNQPHPMPLKTEYGVAQWSWCVHPEGGIVRIFNKHGVLMLARCQLCNLEWFGPV